MPVTGEFRNAALDAMTKGTKPSLLTEYVSVGESQTALTSWKSISTSELEKAAHGLVTGNLVVVSALSGQGGGTGGSDGLKEERPYIVEKISTSVIKLSQTSTISAETFLNTVTAATVTQIKEIAVTARIKTTFGSAAKSVAEDATPRLVGVPACTVNWILYFNHLTETLDKGALHGISKVTAEVFAAAGKYEVEKSKLDLLGVA
jgi:hypothetical protein